MESDLGKLFIGGISWDTNEERLREYFSKYGEVVEAVIMRDRATGRARGFGFIVFADPSIAERVIMDKHMIDGRTVEAKKAVPRDDQHMLKRNPSPILSSPGPGVRTKKIFVGGLPSNITETVFKNYFDQFGTITDVVVMYDHNTQRPRGFGFITYDMEEAVDRVLQTTFHELNGKMVEVKRAVPKELSPGPSRSPFNYGTNRSTSFFNNFAPGYNMGSVGNVGRFSPIGSGRTGFVGFGNAGYGLGMNTEPGLSTSYGGSSTFESTLGYNGRLLNNQYFKGTSPDRYTSPTGNDNRSSDSGYNPTNRALWGNGGTGSLNPIGTTLGVSFGNNGTTWGVSSGLGGSGNSSYGSVGRVYGRNGGAGAGLYDFEGSIGELYRGGSVYGDSTWQPSSTTELEFGYGIGNISSDITTNGSEAYNGSYSVANRKSIRGIEA